jgi:uncharacterized membrane protein
MGALSTVAHARSKLTGRVVTASAVVLTAVTMTLAVVGVGPRVTQLAGRDSVSIPGGQLGRGEIRFFSYRDDGGKQIRFILGRDRAGKVQGAFDACQQCSQYRKGYTSSRGHLVCRICGNRYPLDSRAGVGSCAPIRLIVQDSGKTVTVDTRQLKEHEALF